MFDSERKELIRDFVDCAFTGNWDGLLLVLKAYFDASARPGGLLCVAGYAFPKNKILKFEREWDALFGRFGGLHMKDFVHLQGPYKGVIDHKEKDYLLKKAVKTIKRTAAFGVAISCDFAEVKEITQDKDADHLEHAYPLCCHVAAFSLAEMVRKADCGDICFHFEGGDRYHGKALEFFNKGLARGVAGDLYNLRSVIGTGKTDSMCMNAADFLAWEWTKYMDETLFKGDRPMRGSLKALLSQTATKRPKYNVAHMHGSALNEFYEQLIKQELI